MLFLLSAVLPLQNLHDLAHVGGKAVGQRRQRPDDDIGLRQLQRGGECAEERIRSVGNPGGDLVPHLRPLLSPWPGRRPADAAFGFFFHNLSISAPELYLSRKVLRKGAPGLSSRLCPSRVSGRWIDTSGAVRFLFRIPERCPTCNQMGSIRPEQTIRGSLVTLCWCCSFCSHAWPISDDERQLDRRQAERDRRTVPRSDRRHE